MKKLVLGVVVSMFAAGSLDAATFVSGNLNGLTSLGSFAAGNYAITASGTVDLGGGGTFTLNPDGVPVSTVTSPGYGYFNPNGADYDFNIGPTAYGPAGDNVNLGALLGTLNPAPGGPSDYFVIGFGTTLTLATPATIYAQVNDTHYPNNSGGYTVDVARTAVPEPATWLTMILGFGLIGTLLRRRRYARTIAAG